MEALIAVGLLGAALLITGLVMVFWKSSDDDVSRF